MHASPGFSFMTPFRVNHDQDFCKMIIVYHCSGLFCALYGSKYIQQQMNQITEPNKMNMKSS